MLLIGEDSNAQIRKCNELYDDGELRTDCIGSHGMNRRDSKGEKLAKFLQSNNLFTINAFHKAKSYDTCESFNKEGSLHQIHHFIRCSETKKLALSCRVDNNISVASDHNAISLKLSIVASDENVKPKSHMN